MLHLELEVKPFVSESVGHHVFALSLSKGVIFHPTPFMVLPAHHERSSERPRYDARSFLISSVVRGASPRQGLAEG